MTFSSVTTRYFHTRHQYQCPSTKHAFPFTSSRTFTNFSKLPAEVRLSIWRQCLPKPRAIPIFQKHYDEDGDDPTVPRYECFKPHPTILAVNRESRNEALRFYVMIHGPHKFCVAFDNEKDTIYAMTPPSRYVHSDLSIHLFEKSRFEWLNRGRGRRALIENALTIKSLAVNEADLERSDRQRQYLQLDELIIVLPSSQGFRWADIGGSSQIQRRVFPLQPEIGEAQQKFMREMERWAKKGEGNQYKMPTIKVVRWGTLRTEEDFFCVPLTPLSLRKVDF
jgi:2EXR family